MLKIKRNFINLFILSSLLLFDIILSVVEATNMIETKTSSVKGVLDKKSFFGKLWRNHGKNRYGDHDFNQNTPYNLNERQSFISSSSILKSSSSETKKNGQNQLKEGKLTLQDLPDIALDKIVSHLHTHDNSVLNLKQVSREMRTAVDRNDYGNYSILGSYKKPLHFGRVCRELRLFEKDNYRRQIRKAYVTDQFWVTCGLNSIKMPFLEELFLYGTWKSVDYEDFFKSANVMVNAWEDFYHTSLENNKRLRKFDVLNYYRLNSLQMVIGTSRISPEGKLVKLKKMISSGLVDVNHQDCYGNTPLHTCMLSDLYREELNSFINTTACLEILIQGGAKHNIRNKNGIAPIHLAASLAYIDPLKYLLDTGADINLTIMANLKHDRYYKGESALHMAISYPRGFGLDPEVISSANDLMLGTKYMSRPINEPAYQLWNLLLSNNDNEQLPQYELMRRGIDMTIESVSCGNVLNCAIVLSHSPMLIRKLLNTPYKSQIINAFNEFHYTPLIVAMKLYNKGIALLLIEAGADVNLRFKNKRTPLMLSLDIFTTNGDIAMALLEKNVDVCARSFFRKTALSRFGRDNRFHYDTKIVKNEIKKRYKKNC